MGRVLHLRWEIFILLFYIISPAQLAAQSQYFSVFKYLGGDKSWEVLASAWFYSWSGCFTQVFDPIVFQQVSALYSEARKRVEFVVTGGQGVNCVFLMGCFICHNGNWNQSSGWQIVCWLHIKCVWACQRSQSSGFYVVASKALMIARSNGLALEAVLWFGFVRKYIRNNKASFPKMHIRPWGL